MVYSMRDFFLVLLGAIVTIFVLLLLYYFGGRSKSKQAQWTAVKSRTLVSLADLDDNSQFFVNVQLNGLRITDLLFSEMLKDVDIIQKFYCRGLEQYGHGFVVCECDDYCFICHLKGDGTRIALELRAVEWAPNGQVTNVFRKKITVKNLKDHLSILRQEFGHYSMGFKDCRHFAHSVATYLGS